MPTPHKVFQRSPHKFFTRSPHRMRGLENSAIVVVADSSPLPENRKHVWGVDPNTGDRMWDYANTSFPSGQSNGRDVRIGPDGLAYIVGVDPNSQPAVWKLNVGDGTLSQKVIGLFGTALDTRLAINPDGEVWNGVRKFNSSLSQILNYVSTSIVNAVDENGNIICVGNADPIAEFRDTLGNLLWDFTSTEPARQGMHGTMSADGEHITFTHFSSLTQELRRYDAAGTLIWQKPLSPTVLDNSVFRHATAPNGWMVQVGRRESGKSVILRDENGDEQLDFDTGGNVIAADLELNSDGDVTGVYLCGNPAGTPTANIWKLTTELDDDGLITNWSEAWRQYIDDAGSGLWSIASPWRAGR